MKLIHQVFAEALSQANLSLLACCPAQSGVSQVPSAPAWPLLLVSPGLACTVSWIQVEDRDKGLYYSRSSK